MTTGSLKEGDAVILGWFLRPSLILAVMTFWFSAPWVCETTPSVCFLLIRVIATNIIATVPHDKLLHANVWGRRAAWWAEVCNRTDVTERQFGILITIRRLLAFHLAPFPHSEAHFPFYYIAFVIIICLFFFLIFFAHLKSLHVVEQRKRQNVPSCFLKTKGPFVPPVMGARLQLHKFTCCATGLKKQYRINHQNLTKPIISRRAIHRIIAPISIAPFSFPLPFEPKIWH